VTKFNKIKVFKGSKIKRKNRVKKAGKPVLNVILIFNIRRLSQQKNFKNKDSRINSISNDIKMSKTISNMLKKKEEEAKKAIAEVEPDPESYASKSNTNQSLSIIAPPPLEFKTISILPKKSPKPRIGTNQCYYKYRSN
jgi:hypothetical protein